MRHFALTELFLPIIPLKLITDVTRYFKNPSLNSPLLRGIKGIA
jgi:hypothetical protein